MSQPLLLNFSHPLTDAQRRQLEEKIGLPFEERHLPVHVQPTEDFHDAAVALLEQVQLSAGQWQTTPLLVNPPGLAPLACLLMAGIHGRAGHFPTLVSVRPLPDAPVATFYVSEVLNLQSVREQQRERRMP